MKNFHAILVVCLIAVSFQSFAKIYSGSNDEITGTWLGKLKVPGLELRIVFNIKESENGILTATMDSPDQGAKGIRVDSVIFNGKNIKLEVKAARGYFEGTFNQDSLTITGNWNQFGSSFPILLKKVSKIEEAKRPQEPKPPFPYKVEDVSIKNESAGVTLSGTLTMPETGSSFPAVLLINGSGPGNRDEEIFGHKPFLVVADYLTRKGIAVLRYDKRGIGKSTGNYMEATTRDFVTDALAAVDYLSSRKEINPKEIGLIGHSEGGLIAPLAAVQSNKIDFIVLMAGPGLPGEDILKMQSELILKANGANESYIQKISELNEKAYTLIKTEKDSTKLREKLEDLFENFINDLPENERASLGKDPKNIFETQINQITSPWFKYFLTYDPRPTLRKVKVPVLAIDGSKDLQVPPKEDLDAISKALSEGGNKNYKVEELDGLNHLFQTANTGSPTEYAKIEETIAPKALKIIGDWILKIVHEGNK